MIPDETSNLLDPFQQTSLQSVIIEAADRVASLGTCPSFSLDTAIDNAVWEELVYRMAYDPRVAAELAAGFHLDLSSKVSISAVVAGLRRSEALISPKRELSLAMSIASFLHQATDWVKGELRERGFFLSEGGRER